MCLEREGEFTFEVELWQIPGKILQHLRVGPGPKICTHALLRQPEKAASGAAKYGLDRNIE